ncbi:MAG TPA: putative glycoside hydrolase [Candidatus Sulfotelmatobacter sp.]|nr:putative glycoside hydrolase [Candidatus Sulfotelmatobacter sp.]
MSIALTLLIIASPLAYSANNSNTKEIPSSGIIESNPDSQIKIIFMRHFIHEDAFSAAQIALSTDIWSGHYDALPFIIELRTLNPNMSFLLYRNIRTVWGPNQLWEYNSTELQLFIRSGWVLKDASRNLVVDGNGYLVDVGNKAYQSWLAQWLKSYIEQYGANGAFLDNCLASTEILWGINQAPINPRTGMVWTDQEWHAAIVSLVNEVKAALGNKKYVVGNGIFNGANWNNRLQSYQGLLLNSSIDGIMCEGWISDYSPFWYDELTWKESIDMAVWINNNFLSKSGKFFFALSYNAAQGSVPTGATPEQHTLFSYASLLLAASNDGNSLSYGSYLMNNYTQNLFKLDVGAPVNSYSIIPNTHIYTRDFTNVKVLVNPTDVTYSVDLYKQYFLDGSSLSSLTVQPHTGIILQTK